MDTDTLTALTAVLQDVGVWGIFAWLYVSEKRAHDATRLHFQQYLIDRTQHITYSDSPTGAGTPRDSHPSQNP